MMPYRKTKKKVQKSDEDFEFPVSIYREKRKYSIDQLSSLYSQGFCIG
jgi:hypothetical protein